MIDETDMCKSTRCYMGEFVPQSRLFCDECKTVGSQIADCEHAFLILAVGEKVWREGTTGHKV